MSSLSILIYIKEERSFRAHMAFFFLSRTHHSFGNWQFSPSETHSDTSYLPQLAQFVFASAAAAAAEALS